MNILLYISFNIYVLGAQMNRLIETVLLSTHNICLVSETNLSFNYTLLSGGLFGVCLYAQPSAMVMLRQFT